MPVAVVEVVVVRISMAVSARRRYQYRSSYLEYLGTNDAQSLDSQPATAKTEPDGRALPVATTFASKRVMRETLSSPSFALALFLSSVILQGDSQTAKLASY